MENAAATRSSKWQYPPARTILHLPRKHRRNAGKAKALPMDQKDRRGKLETLFDQERSFDRRGCTFPTPIVLVSDRGWRENECGDGATEMVEEKWRVEVEILRAECNLLRIEKEIALKKMERKRKRLERTLRSAVHSLISGKQRISEGKDVNKVLEQEISHLVEKLHELSTTKTKVKNNMESRDCRNFDRQASVLRRRLENFDDVSDTMSVGEMGNMIEASLSMQHSSSVNHVVLPKSNGNMDILRSKMEALSNGVLLERMEREFGSILLTPISSSLGSKHFISLPDMLMQQMSKETSAEEHKKGCSRHCKEVVRRITEEVRAETEQCTQMQEMLGQVRDEMGELQASRDFWQDRALDSDFQMQNLRFSVQEWRRRAESSEAKVESLQAEVCMLQRELRRLRKDYNSEAKIILPSETEKRVLICRLKENCDANKDDRSKYVDILNRGRTESQTLYYRVPLRDRNAAPSRLS